MNGSRSLDLWWDYLVICSLKEWKMSSLNKKFVEYLGREIKWPDLWEIPSYLSAGTFVSVILHLCPLKGGSWWDIHCTYSFWKVMGVSVFIQPDGVLGGLPNAIRWMLVLFCSRPSWAGGYGGSKGWFWEHRALESAVEGTGDELKDGAVWDPKGDQESFYSAFGLA